MKVKGVPPRAFIFMWPGFVYVVLTCSTGVCFGRANVCARESAMLKLPERGENEASLPNLPVLKIKDGSYNSTSLNKLSPDQNTPALQALINHIYIIKRITKRCFCYLPSSLKQSIFSAILHLITITAKASKSVSLRWEINSFFMILFSVQQQNNLALA